MSLSIIIAIFSVLGAVDLIIGNRLGIGKEFEKGFKLFGAMALSMIGMIILSPFIGSVLKPFTNAIYTYLHIEPSVIPAMLLANDMGGAPLCDALAQSSEMGRFNALVVASMFGTAISFTLPVGLGMVRKEFHKDMLKGFLCGIVTIPVGCFVSGLMLGLNIGELLLNLIPLIIFSVIISLGLIYFPDMSVKIFNLFGKFIKILIITGLALGILKFLVGLELIDGLATLEEGARVCLNASVVMTGAFPLIYIISKILAKPFDYAGKRIGINDTSAIGFCSSVATNLTTFEMMERMDKKGVVLNSAFAISASFTLAGHLAFTMAYDSTYVIPVIIGKLTAGVLAVPVAMLMNKRTKTERIG